MVWFPEAQAFLGEGIDTTQQGWQHQIVANTNR